MQKTREPSVKALTALFPGTAGTLVDSGTWKELDQRGLGGRTVGYKPFTLTTNVAGGITNVRITVRDIDHTIVAKVHCYYYMTSC
ncbi:hypothetical protein [Lentzea sp. NPDC092896]|uniref:hypothetical protein n=1 Tax=Lentzea sp. NPDC092896 TaxID=3364127 RepID=UPI00382907AD